MDKSIVVMFGNVGSGKSTQSRILAERTGFLHLSTGEMLREEVVNGTEVGLRLRDRLAAGYFAPDRDVTQVVIRRISELIEPGIVLDGFPRTLSQAKNLYRMVSVADGTLHLAAVDLQVPPELCQLRLLQRAVEGSPRPEDSGMAIPIRLTQYYKKTQPILDWWRERELPITEVKGTGSPNKVAGAVDRALSRIIELPEGIGID